MNKTVMSIDEWKKNAYVLNKSVDDINKVSELLISENCLSPQYVVKFSEPRNEIIKRVNKNFKIFRNDYVPDNKLPSYLGNFQFDLTDDEKGGCYFTLRSKEKIKWVNKDTPFEFDVVNGSRIYERVLDGEDKYHLYELSCDEKIAVRRKSANFKERIKAFNIAVIYEMNDEQCRHFFSMCNIKYDYKRQWPNFIFWAKKDLGLTVEDYFELLRRFGDFDNIKHNNQKEYSFTKTSEIVSEYNKMIKKCMDIKAENKDGWHNSILDIISHEYVEKMKNDIFGNDFRTRAFIHSEIINHCRTMHSIRKYKTVKEYIYDFFRNLNALYSRHDFSKNVVYDKYTNVVDIVSLESKFAANRYLDFEYIINNYQNPQKDMNPKLRSTQQTASREDFIKIIVVCFPAITKECLNKKLEENNFDILNKDFILDEIILDYYEQNCYDIKLYEYMTYEIKQRASEDFDQIEYEKIFNETDEYMEEYLKDNLHV